MRLYLVQHAEALAADIDPDRALSSKGHDDAVRMGEFFTGKIRPGLLFHSGKTRARQTAEILAASVAPGQSVQALSGLSPNDDLHLLLQKIRQWQEDALIVGHLPFMAKLVSALVIGSVEKSLLSYQPGSMVCLDNEPDGGWQIQWMLRPELLRDSH